jgi:HEPN domain-containing protein
MFFGSHARGDWVHDVRTDKKGNLKIEDYLMASFYLHQTTENLYRTFLLVLTGYVPKTHDLNLLEKPATVHEPRVGEVFPKEDSEDNRRFVFLCKAYIESRYGESFTVDLKDLHRLHKRILIFKELTEKVCLTKGVTPENVREVNDYFAAYRARIAESGPEAINAFIFEWEREHAERLAQDAEERGKKEGLVEGKEEKALEIAKAMKQKGIDLQVIKDISGLSLIEIEKL